MSYAFHYRNIDSTETYARRAYALADGYGSGRAEALCNMAFVSMARMDYDRAGELLDEALGVTDNEVELLVCDVMRMRLCQRMSRNREFYDYRERAMTRLDRINEERATLPPRMQRRMTYAETEMAIVNSAYYYYVGLEQRSADALMAIAPDGDVRRDTAQYLNYLYNVGAGGIINEGEQADIYQSEMEHLMRCFFIARQNGYRFFMANALEAMADHLSISEHRDHLLADNARLMQFILPDSIGGDMAAGWMAAEALRLFESYGDVYQTAGAWRTLASCRMEQGDYEAALEALEQALADPRIEQAPDLVASIREQLSVAFSAVNDKPASDYNRNIYLDMQEQTRQDQYFESRAGMLEKTEAQLNMMIGAVLVAIMVLAGMLWLFYVLNRRRHNDRTIDELLQPMQEWQDAERQKADDLQERMDELNEDYALSMEHIRQGERRSLDNRAKVSLVNSVTPLIDRIINEVAMLATRHESDDMRAARFAYIAELTAEINGYNDVLTQWIQMRQGRIDLHIESFDVQPLFDIVAKGKAGFRMNGVELDVRDTTARVKADRVLTLFMINTLADNARKFTPAGGRVTISATQADDYVEISVEDTGHGMTADEQERIFAHKVYDGHGFGLMNCRGIVERYRKISRIFSVCTLSAESEPGRGSRFFFRLPTGIVRTMVITAMLACTSAIHPQTSPTTPQPSFLQLAKTFADSAYFSNIDGTYERTLSFADSCLHYLNSHYRSLNPEGDMLMEREGDTSATPSEIIWFQDSLPVNYDIILDIRNENAVAALALHRWRLYTYNNKVYTQLFKEMSADNTLPDYCRMMQQSQANKTIAIIILVLLLIAIPPAFYLLYYRHRLYFRFCMERIRTINGILLCDDTPADKLRRIEPLTHEQYPAELQAVADRITQALREAIAAQQRHSTDMELAEDERRKAEYEENNLHVSNAVLDNCLSALKHETMYYPSRISQLVADGDKSLEAMSELVTYYRDIYSILSRQAMRQTDRQKIHITVMPIAELTGEEQADMTVYGDRNMLAYLMELLRRANGGQAPEVTAEARDDRYVQLIIAMRSLHITPAEAQRLFTPSPQNIPFLLCRQIVRDHSEATNRRGCGITAETAADGTVAIRVTLPKAPTPTINHQNPTIEKS